MLRTLRARQFLHEGQPETNEGRTRARRVGAVGASLESQLGDQRAHKPARSFRDGRHRVRQEEDQDLPRHAALGPVLRRGATAAAARDLQQPGQKVRLREQAVARPGVEAAPEQGAQRAQRRGPGVDVQEQRDHLWRRHQRRGQACAGDLQM